MPQEMQIQAKSWYLHVQVSGVFDLEFAKSFFQEVLDESQHSSLPKILIDCRMVKGAISMIDRFELSKCISDIQKHMFRVVLVGPEEKVLPVSFLENTLTNRGIISKATSNIKEALEWLKTNQIQIKK